MAFHFEPSQVIYFKVLWQVVYLLHLAPVNNRRMNNHNKLHQMVLKTPILLYFYSLSQQMKVMFCTSCSSGYTPRLNILFALRICCLSIMIINFTCFGNTIINNIRKLGCQALQLPSISIFSINPDGMSQQLKQYFLSDKQLFPLVPTPFNNHHKSQKGVPLKKSHPTSYKYYQQYQYSMDWLKKQFQNSPAYYSVPCFKYENDIWQTITCEEKTQNIIQKNLTFLTYNVWFEKHNFQERVVEILMIIKQQNCDFVCLQEVTYDFQVMMSKDQFIEQTYFISGNKINDYGVLILTKFKPKAVIELAFKSQFGRTFLYIISKINNEDMVVGTSHLESMIFNEQLRQEQLQAVYKELGLYKNAIIMGDFNLETENDELSISNNYNDIWKLLHPLDSGYTFVIENFKRRFDRVLLKKDGTYKAQSIQIVGTNELPLYKDKKQLKPGEVKTPSDHYALIINIQYLL